MTRHWRILLAVLLFSIAEIYLLYFVKQSAFVPLVLSYGTLFISYAYCYFGKPRISHNKIIIAWLVTRCIGLFAFPSLSDDIYRFWWDGYFATQGFNPFTHTPTQILAEHSSFANDPNIEYIFRHLNSPDYFSVYPSVSQVIFFISAAISGTNITVFAFVVKVIFILAEWITILCISKVLKPEKSPQKSLIFYLFNPLIVIELHGNLHFELLMIMGLALSFYYIKKNNFTKAGLSYGVSIMSKLTSAIFAPFLLLHLYKQSSKKTWQFIATTTIVSASILLWLIVDLAHFIQSIGLYFNQFEFNSFLYYPLYNYLNQHHYHFLRSNLGILLLASYMLAYLYLLYRYFINSVGTYRILALALILYLLCASTVHPWYISTLVFLGIFVLRYSILSWSLLIILSYAKYDTYFNAYRELLIALEYLLLIFALIIEIYLFNDEISNEL